MSILTRVVVFGDDPADAGAVGVQLFGDSVANINEDGSDKTVFYPGDDFYCLLIVPPEYRLLSVKTTHGALVALGQVTRAQVDRLLFGEIGEQQQLAQLPSGEVSPQWYGRSAVLTVAGQQVAANAAPCIADLSYSYQAQQYRLTAPANLAIGTEDGDDWPIGIVVYVEAVI